MSSPPAVAVRTPRAPALPALLFLLLVLAVYSDPLFSARTFAGRDLTAYNLPIEKAIHDAYARGRLPVWLSEVSGGRPLLPNPNIGALYPLRPLLAVLPFPLAARLFPILHWAAAGIGMILLLRTFGCSAAAAWVGAVTYVFSGVSVSEVFFPHLPGLALLPWVVRAFARLPESGRRGVVWLSLLLALDLLAGDVFTVGLALGACVLWSLREVPRVSPGRSFARLAASLALAVLAAAPQILATALWIPETQRSVLGLRLGEVFYFSIHPARLLELVVPFPFGETWTIDPSRIWTTAAFGGKTFGMFATLYAGALGAIAVAETWRARAAGLRFARALAALAALAAVLPSLMPARWAHLPSPVSLRNPEKLAIGLTFALAIMAAHAFDRFRERGAPRWLVAAGGLYGLAAPALLLGNGAAPGAPSALAANAVAEGGLLWMATVIAVDALRRGIGLPVLMLTAVPIAANQRIAATFREDEVFPPTAFARYFQRADPRGEYRALGALQYRPPSALQNAQHGSDLGYLWFSRRNWDQYTPVLWGRGTVFNYDFDAGDLARVESLRRLARSAASYSDASAFFGTLALRYAVRFRDQPALPGYRRFHGDALQDWDEHEQPFADVRLLTSWREEADAVAAAGAIPHLRPGEVVLETGGRGSGASPPGELRVIEKSPERLRLETRSSAPSWLFVLRGFWRHREIRLDGEPVLDVPAQVGFSALAVAPGTHRIDWREQVPGGRMSRWGPVLYLLVSAWIFAASASRRRVART
jgi:hypothetical protein